MKVVSNTSPLCYLVLIGEVEVLPRIFGEIAIPEAVGAELGVLEAPEAVRAWIDSPPSWLSVRSAPESIDPRLAMLQRGEREAISLASSTEADLVILDDGAARRAAAALGLRLTGLLGVLDRGAKLGHLDLRRAVARLRQSNFRIAPKLLHELLTRS